MRGVTRREGSGDVLSIIRWLMLNHLLFEAVPDLFFVAFRYELFSLVTLLLLAGFGVGSGLAKVCGDVGEVGF